MFVSQMNSSEMIGQSSPVILSPLDEAPSTKSVCQWLEKRQIEETLSQSKHSKPKDRSQLEAPSMNNSYGFRVSFGNCLEAKSVHQVIDFNYKEFLSSIDYEVDCSVWFSSINI